MRERVFLCLEARICRAPAQLRARLHLANEVKSPLISAEEAVRAERFVHISDRRRHVAARGLLRLVLAVYLGASRDAVAFRSNSDGKPRLAHPERLRFNLSHSLVSGFWL